MQNNKELISTCLNLCEKALNAQSVLVWRQVLHAHAKIFEMCKGEVDDLEFDLALKTLANLREDTQCSVKGDVDLVSLLCSFVM